MKRGVRTSVLSLASAAGYSWTIVRRPVRFLPELAGLCVISRGVDMIYPPAGWIAAGVCLLLVGASIPRKPAPPDGR